MKTKLVVFILLAVTIYYFFIMDQEKKDKIKRMVYSPSNILNQDVEQTQTQDVVIATQETTLRLA